MENQAKQLITNSVSDGPFPKPAVKYLPDYASTFASAPDEAMKYNKGSKALTPH